MFYRFLGECTTQGQYQVVKEKKNLILKVKRIKVFEKVFNEKRSFLNFLELLKILFEKLFELFRVIKVFFFFLLVAKDFIRFYTYFHVYFHAALKIF